MQCADELDAIVHVRVDVAILLDSQDARDVLESGQSRLRKPSEIHDVGKKLVFILDQAVLTCGESTQRTPVDTRRKVNEHAGFSARGGRVVALDWESTFAKGDRLRAGSPCDDERHRYDSSENPMSRRS